MLALPSAIEAGAVFWSPQGDVFGAGKQYLQDKTVATWLGEHIGAKVPTAPELLVVMNNGASSKISTKLRNVIAASPSSAVAPFADDLSDIGAPGERLDATSWVDAHSLLASRIALASNGVCDVLVVAAAVDEDDATFAAFRSKVEDSTGGAAAFALAVAQPSAESEFTSKYVEIMTATFNSNSRRLSTSSYESPKKYVRMTPDLLAGILTGILLVVIALIGLTCLNSIQTPSMYTSKNFPSSREY
jgi:hypothetical protein